MYKKIFFLCLISVMAFSQDTTVTWDEVGEHFVCQSSFDKSHYWKNQINWPVIDKNWKTVATKMRNGAKWCASINGKKGSYYAEIKDLQFTPIGDTLIYIGTKGANQLFRKAISVRKIDERDERSYDEVFPTVFSPDGKSWSYRVKEENSWYLVYNGTENQRYDFIEQPKFNPNGNLIVHKAKENDRNFLVVNGFEGKFYDNISDLTFNPMTNDLAYWGEKENRFFLVVNDSEINVSSRKPSQPNTILYSSNGKSFLYCLFEKMNNKEQYYVVYNDVYSKSFDKIKWLEIKFSPDGNSIVYPAGRGNNEFIVLNQKEEESFEEVRSPIFSNDGFSLMYSAYEGNKWFTVINRRKEKRYSDVKENLFHLNNIDYFYAAKDENKWFLVKSGVENERKYDDIFNVLIDKTGENVAYIGRIDSVYRVVYNDKESADYSQIEFLKFLPSSKSITFQVTDRLNGTKCIVTEKGEGKRYKDVSKVYYSSDGMKFGYFALDAKDNIVWVVSE